MGVITATVMSIFTCGNKVRFNRSVSFRFLSVMGNHVMWSSYFVGLFVMLDRGMLMGGLSV